MFEGNTLSNPCDIFHLLAKEDLPLEKVGLETGSLSRYLTKGLQSLGCPVICIDARKMAAILSVTVNKTDKNDARGIADAIRCNHYKESQIKGDLDASMNIY